MYRRSEGFSSFPLYKMEIYFDSYPEIDVDEFISFINSTDPELSGFQFSKVRLNSAPNAHCHEMFTGTMNGKTCFFFSVHDMPSPDGEPLAHARLSREQKNRFAEHRAFGMACCVGLEDDSFRPFENILMVYKIAMGLCRCGAIGAGNPITNHFYDRDRLLGFLEDRYESIEGEPLTLWQSIRRNHEPAELLMYFTHFEAGGADWLGTRGFSYCGFPDLFYRLADERDKSRVCEIFFMLFHHFMAHGPAVKPGDSMHYKWPIRFHELPIEIDPPYQVPDMLMITLDR
ncbi:MAG: hypothetical protein ABFD69_14860 [Candidatus Sumerlaeia bacterium]